MIEFFYKILGYRKARLLGDAPSYVDLSKFSLHRRTPVFGKVPELHSRMNDSLDLSGGSEINQGQTSSCACATLCGIALDYAIRTTKNKSISIDWEYAWNHMKEMGIASEEGGSWLEENIWYAQNIGYKDNYGDTWKIDVVEPISRADIERYLRMGYQVYTGAMVGSPMCDKEWVFRAGHRKYGHSFRLMGIIKRMGLFHFMAETTWLNYGIKEESQFMVKKLDSRALFKCYVMTFKKV